MNQYPGKLSRLCLKNSPVDPMYGRVGGRSLLLFFNTQSEILRRSPPDDKNVSGTCLAKSIWLTYGLHQKAGIRPFQATRPYGKYNVYEDWTVDCDCCRGIYRHKRNFTMTPRKPGISTAREGFGLTKSQTWSNAAWTSARCHQNSNAAW